MEDKISVAKYVPPKKKKATFNSVEVFGVDFSF